MSPRTASLVEEIIRGVLAVLLLAGFFTAVFLAARRFVGIAGRTVARPTRMYAAISGFALLVLLIVRKPLESAISAGTAPLSRIATSGWPEQAAIGLFRTLVATLALVLLIQAIGWVYWSIERRLLARRAVQKGMGAHALVLVMASIRVIRHVAVLIAVIVTLPVILNQFPRTKPLIDSAANYLVTPAREVGNAVLQYLPNLAYLAVILVAGLYGLKIVKYFFNSIENGSVVVRGFPREWAAPTYSLVRTLFVVFLVMVSYPYLPGSKSQFFQGFSVFVGALITFGSTATIGNIVSGTVLTYTRAFKIGDMVTIGEKTGIVVEKTLLVTRLLTPRNEEVSMPNGNVVSGSIVNYSARAREGLALSVTAGIGYDVDWRKVHQLMIDGARATERIVADPAPHVLQSALGDYAVNYELRAFTRDPQLMFGTLSELHANVLDAFNRAGVEIMTPSILAHRDASGLAIPLDQFRDRPTPAGISVEVKTNGSVASAL